MPMNFMGFLKYNFDFKYLDQSPVQYSHSKKTNNHDSRFYFIKNLKKTLFE